MKLHEYVKKSVRESIEQVRSEQLFESIRPIVAQLLMEEEKSEKKKDGKKKKNGKIDIDSLVKKLMKNKKFRKKAAEYLSANKTDSDFGFRADGKAYKEPDEMTSAEKVNDVTDRFKDKKIKQAPIAYNLYPDMTEDGARHVFSNKLKNKSFTDEEWADIYLMLNNDVR